MPFARSLFLVPDPSPIGQSSEAEQNKAAGQPAVKMAVSSLTFGEKKTMVPLAREELKSVLAGWWELCKVEWDEGTEPSPSSPVTLLPTPLLPHNSPTPPPSPFSFPITLPFPSQVSYMGRENYTPE